MRPAGRADERVVDCDAAGDRGGDGGVLPDDGFRDLAGEARSSPGPAMTGPDAVGPDVLPAVRHVVARQARDGIGLDPPVAGWPAGGHVRGSCRRRRPARWCRSTPPRWTCWCCLDDGVPGRVELTGMIDVATRVVPAAVLRPTTRSVDASVLLARALTPEPVRPGWPEALTMAQSVLPYERLLSDRRSPGARRGQAGDRPGHHRDRPRQRVCVGRVPVLCRHLGISLQPAHLGSGSEKGHIERHFGSVASLFCQFASGYAGRSPDRRGRGIAEDSRCGRWPSCRSCWMSG